MTKFTRSNLLKYESPKIHKKTLFRFAHTCQNYRRLSLSLSLSFLVREPEFSHYTQWISWHDERQNKIVKKARNILSLCDSRSLHRGSQNAHKGNKATTELFDLSFSMRHWSADFGDLSLCSCVSSIKSISCSSISNVRPRCDYPGIRLLSARFSLSLFVLCACAFLRFAKEVTVLSHSKRRWTKNCADLRWIIFRLIDWKYDWFWRLSLRLTKDV